ncbi:MAG: flagellar biosynthesis regulator FlaF, partial [Microvirga sp.]
DAANPLPAAIKQNVANLGIFIFNHTLAVMTQPAPERLAILIDINREIAAGLRGPAAQAA